MRIEPCAIRARLRAGEAAARLQTIPDSFDFGCNSAADIDGMIGDAVPVDLASWMASRLLAALPPAS